MFAPPFATHAMLVFGLNATAIGKSPDVDWGCPTIWRIVGSCWLMLNMVKVLLPALTLKRNYN